jgi:hypothetical protein
VRISASKENGVVHGKNLLPAGRCLEFSYEHAAVALGGSHPHRLDAAQRYTPAPDRNQRSLIDRRSNGANGLTCQGISELGNPVGLAAMEPSRHGWTTRICS